MQNIVFCSEVGVVMVAQVGKLMATAFVQVIGLAAIGILPRIDQVAIYGDTDNRCMACGRRVGLAATQGSMVVIAHMGVYMTTAGIHWR